MIENIGRQLLPVWVQRQYVCVCVKERERECVWRGEGCLAAATAATDDDDNETTRRTERDNKNKNNEREADKIKERERERTERTNDENNNCEVRGDHIPRASCVCECSTSLCCSLPLLTTIYSSATPTTCDLCNDMYRDSPLPPASPVAT